MESDPLCTNLLKWLATFDAGEKVTKPSDISDGVIIAAVLHAIEPLWFDASWLGKIKPDVGGNRVFKISNLKKVTQGISDCFSDSLELNISHLPKPDVSKLGEDNPEEAGRLLQLVLGVAVNCSRKHEYIEAIQRLELSVQAVLMAAIQELMRGGGGESMRDVDRMRGMVRDYDVMKDERKQRCFELNNQIALLHDENAALQAENQQLQKRLSEQHELPQPVSPVAEGPDQSQRYKQLRGKLAAADDEIYKLEAVREEFRIKCEVMEKDLRETQAKNEELQRMADETRCLRDELDILRDTSSKVTQWETALDTYKKRLQEMGDLRRQIKLLEDKNTDYMQHNMELEEELKKSGSYRPQLDLYKKQVGELHEQLAEEVKKRDKAEFDLRKLTEKMTALQSEKERLTAERDKLREVNDELKLAQLQLSGAPPPLGGRPGNGCSSSAELDTIEQIPTDVKEKLLRLQYENRQLRSQVSAGDQQPDEACRALRDDLRRDTNLQAENRWASDTQLLPRRPAVARPPLPPPPAVAAPPADQVTIRHIHEIKLCTSPEPAERRCSPGGDSGVRLSPSALIREYVDQLVSSASTPRRYSPVVCARHEGRCPRAGAGTARSPSAAYTEEYIRRLQDMATSTTELLPAAPPPPLPPLPAADDAVSVASRDDAVSVASSRGPQRFTRQGSIKYKQERWPGNQRQRSLKVPARKEDSLDSGCACSTSRRTTLDAARRLDLECGSGTTTMTGVTERSDTYLERRMSFIGRYDGQYGEFRSVSAATRSDSSGSLLDEPLYATTPSKDSAVGSRATPSLASAEDFHPEVLRPFSPAARLAPLAERSPPRDDQRRSRGDSDEQELPTIVRWRSRSFRRPRRSRSRSKSQKRRSKLMDTVTLVGATFAMCAP